MCDAKIISYAEEFRRQIINEKPGVEKYYDSVFPYECPICQEQKQLVFVQMDGMVVRFFCAACTADFAAKDKESGLPVHREDRLRERYPKR